MSGHKQQAATPQGKDKSIWGAAAAEAQAAPLVFAADETPVAALEDEQSAHEESANTGSVYDWKEIDMSGADHPYQWMTFDEAEAKAEEKKESERRDQMKREEWGHPIAQLDPVEEELRKAWTDHVNPPQAATFTAHNDNAPLRIEPKKPPVDTHDDIQVLVDWFIANRSTADRPYEHNPEHKNLSHLAMRNEAGEMLAPAVSVKRNLTGKIDIALHKNKQDGTKEADLKMQDAVALAMRAHNGSIRLKKGNSQNNQMEAARAAIVLRKEGKLAGADGKPMSKVYINGKSPEEILGLPAYVAPTTTVIRNGKRVAPTQAAPPIPAEEAKTAPATLTTPPATTPLAKTAPASTTERKVERQPHIAAMLGKAAANGPTRPEQKPQPAALEAAL